MDAKTFKSKDWRCNVRVFDLRGPFAPKDRPALTFSVSILPATAHRSTAFSAGALKYYGPSLREAITAARRFTPEAGIPDQWRRYETNN